ncbi:MAG: ABC transporter permease [Propionibacterium sp.]|nr:ABC transporter permease [Propionibacterium sp.]
MSARLIAGNSGLSVSGSVQQQQNLHRLIDGADRILVGLLAMVVVVAMVGVANTPGLSVIERTRESALLRALGLGRAALRAMLLAEALMICGAAAVVGLVVGVGTGWSGAADLLSVEGDPTPPLVVPWPSIGLALILVLVAAAAASVLPGGAAARVSPVEALADLG